MQYIHNVPPVGTWLVCVNNFEKWSLTLGKIYQIHDIPNNNHTRPKPLVGVVGDDGMRHTYRLNRFNIAEEDV